MIINACTNDIRLAVAIAGSRVKLGKALGVSYQAIQRWEKLGALPKSDYLKETHYARDMVKLTKGKAKLKNLLPPLK